MKIQLRDVMAQYYTDGELGDARLMAQKVRELFGVQKFSVDMFSPGDTVIAGTHKTNDKLLEMGIVSGYLSALKERSKEFVEGWKARGSFTTHSYQGSTIREGKVFVVVDDSFEMAMIYTAVSRAVLSTQIVFVTL
jgi:hypothetical protein